MTKYGSDDVFLLFSGFDISGDTFELQQVKEALLEATHGFGDAWEEQSAVGVKTGGVNHRSFYDDATGATNEALFGGMGFNRPMLAGLEGNAQGKKCIAFNPMQRNYVRSPARGELHKVSAEYLSHQKISEAEIIQSLAAQTAAGAGSDGSLDNGAQSTSGGTAYLEITALDLDGYTSVTIQLEESSDNGAGDPWTQVGSAFTAATARGGARIEISGTIERYTRATVTWNGAGTSPSVTYIVALERD